MERHEAFFLAVSHREAVIDLMRTIIGSKVGDPLPLRTLDELISDTHEACEGFNAGDACEEFEDLYLPIFDSLSYLKSARHACNGRGVRAAIFERVRVDVEHAIESLDELLTANAPY